MSVDLKTVRLIRWTLRYCMEEMIGSSLGRVIDAYQEVGSCCVKKTLLTPFKVGF